MPRDASPPQDLADRIEVRVAPASPRGNLIPALARLLRRLRDRKPPPRPRRH